MTGPPITAETPGVADILTEIVEVLVAGGATFHRGLRIVEADGAMSLHIDDPVTGPDADGDRRRSMLARIPVELLVPIEAIRWAPDPDRLIVESVGPGLSATRRRLLDAHVALYNITGKPAWARRHLPRVALASDDPLWTAVGLLRPGVLAADADRPTGDDRSMAEAFIATRTLGAARSDVTGDDGAPPGPVLMPIIDLMNHHRRGAGYSVADGMLRVLVRRPAGGSECFATYGGGKDALDLAIGYGYLEPDPGVARCAPCAVEVAAAPEVGTVRVRGLRVRPKHRFDPPTVDAADDGLTLSHLSFAPDHIDRLVALLALPVTAHLRRSGAATNTATSDARPAAAVALVAALIEHNRTLVAQAVARVGDGDRDPNRGAVVDLVGAALEVQARVLDECLTALGDRVLA